MDESPPVEVVPHLPFDPFGGSPPSWQPPRPRVRRVLLARTNPSAGLNASKRPRPSALGGAYLVSIRRKYLHAGPPPGNATMAQLRSVTALAAASNRQRAFTCVLDQVEQDYVAAQPQVEGLAKERAEWYRGALSAKAKVAPPCGACGSTAASATGSSARVQVLTLEGCFTISMPLFECSGSGCGARLHASPASLGCFPATAAAWDLSGSVHRWLDLGLLGHYDRLIHIGGHPSVHGLATALHSTYAASPVSEKISFNILKKVLNDTVLVWTCGVDGGCAGRLALGG